MAGPIPFGEYELLERIAEGGMAEVWRARSRGAAGFEKTVVIKRLLPSLMERPGFAELLVREAKIAARLSHPNIVQIYDLGEEGGGYFIAMEFLRGRDLAAAMSHRASGEGALPTALRLWIASEVARALEYAHRARGEDGKPLNIVHRDVSPQNVLLGYEGEVKVADFGIARADERGLGRGEDPKILRGKYAYMSPEQARGEPLDRRSDLFSLGILLYELVARRRMFHGRTAPQTLEMVRRGRMPDYRAHVGVPGLAPILEKALAPRRDDRYASAGELHAELVSVLAQLGKPVGQPDLAAAMAQMFPDQDRVSPNKLSVDVLIRAYDDATGTSESRRVVPTGTTEKTQALPSSRKLRGERRHVALLALASRPGDEALFERAIELTGGRALDSQSGLRVALYGLPAVERAASHAARGALELRRSFRLEGPARVQTVPSIAIVGARVGLLEGAVLEPEAESMERVRALLAGTEPGDVRIELALREELGRDFLLRDDGGSLVVESFRARRDRDAGAMRQRAPLIGQRPMLRELAGLLVDAAAGRGQLVHIVGEPGSGKSRLLAELRASAAPRDFAFVQGRSDEADQERPLAVLADLVHDLCGIEPEDTPTQRFAKVERLCVLGLSTREVRWLGELVGLAYPLPPDDRHGRPRAIEVAFAIRKAIRALASDRAVVLALEDLQWMDDVARQVLPLLVEGLAPARVLVLTTRRPGSSGPWPVAARSLRLSPLDVEGTGQLLAFWLRARSVEPGLADLAWRETGGIPAWIELLAPLVGARVREDGVAEIATTGTLALPDAVRSAVGARIARLRSIDRSLLRVAAAMGGASSVETMYAAEGLIGHTGRAPLRRLLARQLLVSAGREASTERAGAWGGDEADAALPAEVRVPSELLARAVLAELDEAERRRLHGRIAATLERLGAGQDVDGAEQLARHAALAPDPRRAPDYFVRAAELAQAGGAAERAARLRVEAAELAANDVDAAAAMLAERAARAALALGDLELAERALGSASERADAADEPLSLRIAMLRASLASRAGRPDDAVRLLRAAASAAKASAERDHARIQLGIALFDAGANEEATRVLDDVVTEAEGELRGRAMARLAGVLAVGDQLERADSMASEALALAARVGAPGLRHDALAALGAVLETKGQLAAAAARFSEAAELARDVGDHAEAAEHGLRAALAALRGDDDATALARARLASESARAIRLAPLAALADAIASVVGLRAEPTQERLVAISAQLDASHSSRRIDAAHVAELRAAAQAAAGDLGAARQALEQAAELAREAGWPARARALDARRARLDSTRTAP